MAFINALAWIFGALATLLLLARLVGYWTYTERHKVLDQLRGIERSFPITWPFTISVICWTWLITGGIK